MPLPPIPGADWLRFRADAWRKQQQAQLDALKEQASAWDLHAQSAVHGIGDTFSSIGAGVQQGVQSAREAVQEVAPPPPPPLPVADWAQQAQSAIDAIPSLGGLQDFSDRQAQNLNATAERYASEHPDLPMPLGVLAGAGGEAWQGLGRVQQKSGELHDAAMGFGPQGANLPAQAGAGLQVATTPYTLGGQVASELAGAAGGLPETQAAAQGVMSTVGPGGTIGSIAGGLNAAAPTALRFAAPALGAVGAATGIGTGIAAGAPPDEVLTRGFEGANMGAGVGELGAHLLPQVPGIARGVADYAGRFGEAAQSLYDSELGTLGARRGQRGVRVPPLSPEQAAQRAADGAAEQRIFDAIQRLWRQGPEGEALADDLRFAAVGKGEEGEAAARALLAERGLDDLLPSGVIPDATPAGEGLLGAATRATDPVMARGALTGGERAFDIGAGTAGGVLGAATAPDDATWQERAGRGAVGASLGALAGANARQLARIGSDADVLGAAAGRARGNAADSAADAVNLRARRAEAATRNAEIAGVAPPGGASAARVPLPPQEALRRLTTTPADRYAIPGASTASAADRFAIPGADAAAGAAADPYRLRSAAELEAATRTLAQPKPADPAGANAWEKALAFMTSNLLSNPRSLLGNAMGGVEQAATRWGGYALEGRKGDVWTELKAAWAAKGDALRGALQQGLTGERPAAVSTALQEATDTAHPEAFPGKAGLLATPALRVAGATDALFAMGARAGAEAVADARGLTGAERAAFIKAQTAQSVISAPASPLAKTISEGRRLLTAPDSTLPDRLKGAAMFAAIPVVRIPQTIWEQGVKRAVSPVTGLPTAAVQAATGDTAAAGKTLKNWAVNSTIGGVIVWQVGDGNITGSGPQDPNERRRWEAQGWRPTSVRVGGNWYSYDWLGPLGLQMNLTATFAETLAAEQRVPTKSELDRYTAAVGRVGATAIDEHYLSNFFKMAHSIGQGDLPDVAAKNVEELGARLVPYAGALNWAAKGADDVVREPQGPLEEVQARIPGLRGGVPARIDPTTGKPQRVGGTTLERLGGFGRITPETTPAAREVARLQQAKQDVSIRAFSPGEKYRDVAQTREQRRALATAYGEETAKATAEVFDPKTPVGKAYAKADDAEKARLLRSRLEHAAVLADITAGAKVARTPKGLADYEYAAVPHYDGVGGSADAVRRGNEAVRDAKSQLAAYKKKYPADGEDRFERDFPKLYELSQLAAADADELKERRAAIDKKHTVTR